MNGYAYGGAALVAAFVFAFFVVRSGGRQADTRWWSDLILDALKNRWLMTSRELADETGVPYVDTLIVLASLRCDGLVCAGDGFWQLTDAGWAAVSPAYIPDERAS